MKKEGQPQHEHGSTEKAKGWLRRKATKRNVALFAVGSVAAAGALYLAIHGIHTNRAHHAVTPDNSHALKHRPDMTPDSPHMLKHRPDMTPDSNPIHDAATQHLNHREMG